MTFYVYVDWTKESPPRPFYVGKGKHKRLRVKSRNKHHSNVSAKHGRNRKIAFITDDENLAFEKEKELILEYKTCVHNLEWNKIGCNYTIGGDGSAGSPRIKTEEHRKKISDKLRGNKNASGRLVSEETRKQISQKLKGHSISEETKKKISLSVRAKLKEKSL